MKAIFIGNKKIKLPVLRTQAISSLSNPIKAMITQNKSDRKNALKESNEFFTKLEDILKKRWSENEEEFLSLIRTKYSNPEYRGANSIEWRDYLNKLFSANRELIDELLTDKLKREFILMLGGGVVRVYKRN